MVDASEDGSGHFRVHALPPWARVVAAVCFAVSRGSLPALLLLVVLANDPPVTPPVLFRLTAVFVVLPGVAAWVVERAHAADVEVGRDALVIAPRGLRIEVPADAIARVTPWAVPVPEPGLTLHLRSGRRLRQRLARRDPEPLLVALARRGGVAAARAALAHPTVVYAHAKPATSPYRLLAKFGLFALLPTALLFNAHQHIAHGALLGEYYLMGLRSYLATFATYWLVLVIYLVLWAAVWRGPAEAVALLAARVAPSRAARVRRGAEIACRLLYYGGVPALLLIRFLP